MFGALTTRRSAPQKCSLHAKPWPSFQAGRGWGLQGFGGPLDIRVPRHLYGPALGAKGLSPHKERVVEEEAPNRFSPVRSHHRSEKFAQRQPNSRVLGEKFIEVGTVQSRVHPR